MQTIKHCYIAQNEINKSLNGLYIYIYIYIYIVSPIVSQLLPYSVEQCWHWVGLCLFYILKLCDSDKQTQQILCATVV